MYDRIIVPVDEGAGLDSLECALQLARTVNAELTILHVHRPQQAPTELEGLPQYRYQHVVEAWDERDAVAEAREVEWLKDLADQAAAAHPELDISARVVHAPLSRCIDKEGEKLLAVARADGPDRDRLRPTVQDLIRTCGVPVLMYTGDMRVLPIRRILVTLDGSQFAEEVLVPACDLARATGARLSLLEVVTRHSGLVRLLHPAERSADAAERSLAVVAGRIPPELGPVETRVAEHASAAGGILMEAKRGESDMVAIATHGRGGLRRLVLGSVAESVLQSSPLPVLLFRPLGVGADASNRDRTAASNA
jgi:nucleotide-binding universal stress UspA family protein